jgi:hypothetical protein
MIHKQEPLTNVLRLLVLFSVTNSGLPKKQFDYIRQVKLPSVILYYIFQFSVFFLIISCLRVSTFRMELLHSYGFEHVVTLNNLEKAGLLKKQVW